jgi:peptide/nickel transport system substrate-binding protein
MTTSKAAPIMTHLAVPILPQHIWKSITATQVKKFANEPTATAPVVGSGPFILTERKAGQFIRLEANKNYWGGAPKIDELIYRIYRNADSLAQALKQGEVDFADNLDADVWSSLKTTGAVKTYAAKYSGFDELAFNTGAALADGTPIGDGSPATADPAFRRAVSHAIDRQTLVSRVLQDTGTVGSTLIPPIYAKTHLEPATAYAFDPAQANQLLDAAGYAKGAKGLRTLKDGKPLKLRQFARQESQTSQQSVELIASWFAKVGVATTVKVVSEAALVQIVGEGNYDMFEWGWVVEPDPDYQLSTMTCAQRSTKDAGTTYSGLSDSFYCNKAYDALYAQQAGQIDVTQRTTTLKQMQQLLYDDAPYAVLYYYDDLQAYSTKFAGFMPQPAPNGVLLFQYGTWSYRNLDLASRISVTPGRAAGAVIPPADPGDKLNLPAGWLVAGAIAVLVIGFGGLLLTRRRREEPDVE